MVKINGGSRVCACILLRDSLKILLTCHSSSQSQSINPLYLSTVSNATPNDPSRRKYIDRKTDYVLSFSHRDADISNLYKRLETADQEIIGHTLDTFTKRTALFSGFEVKTALGDHIEAELQMSIWIAASLRKKQELAQTAQLQYDAARMVEPALTIVGHRHSIYYAYPRQKLALQTSDVHVLSPDGYRFAELDTKSIRGIFRLIKFYGNLLKYGMDKEEDGYWGGFLEPVLKKLADFKPPQPPQLFS